MATQLIKPNPNIWCRPGYCLEYVRKTFNLPIRYNSATEAWTNASSPHADRNFPVGVDHPVWYGLYKEPLGHVVLRMADGSVYSTSDNTNVPHHHPSLEDLEAYYARYDMPLFYRGWSEDVAGFPVINLDGINPQGSITLSQEDDVVTETDVAAIAAATVALLMTEKKNGNTLGEVIAENRGQHTDSLRVIKSIPIATLNAEIPRGGQMGGKTSLGAMVSWNDEHVIQQIAASASAAASDGASVDEIKAAVKQAIKETSIKVDVHIGEEQTAQ